VLFYREVGDKDKGSLSLWIVAVCEKRLFRFILSIIILNKDKLIHWSEDLYSSKAHSQSMAHLGLER